MALQLCQYTHSHDITIVSVYPVSWRSPLRGSNEIDNKLGCLFPRPPRGRMHCSVGRTDHDGSGPLSQSDDAKLWNAHCQSPMVTVTLNSLVRDNYKRVDGKEIWKFLFPAVLRSAECMLHRYRTPCVWCCRSHATCKQWTLSPNCLLLSACFPRTKNWIIGVFMKPKTPHVETRDPVWRWLAVSSYTVSLFL